MKQFRKQDVWTASCLAVTQSDELFFPFPEYCHDFNDKSCQNQNGGQSNMLEIKHFWIKHIGVRGASTNHQDEAQGKQGDTDEHDDVVLFAEGHDLLVVSNFGRFCFCLCYFLCHIQ